MVRVDRFILLTKQMAVPLHVGNRPYLVMEGMCGDVADEPPVSKPQPFSMLYTGRLNRRYGLELLLQAMKELHDPDIELWLCGSGEMEEEIRAYIERVRAALKALTPEERDIIMNFYFSENPLSGEALAEKFATTKSSIYRRRDHALRKLKSILGNA